MIKNLIIAWAARNIDTLIDFLVSLDKKLDAHVAAQNAALANNRAEIDRLENEQNAILDRQNLTKNLQGGLRGITSNTQA